MIRIIIFIATILSFTACSKDVLDYTQNGVTTDFKTGKGVVSFTAYQSLEKKPINVHYYIPENGDSKTMPILFVMPGTERNANDYLNGWIAQANSKKIIILSLEFPSSHYSNSQYIEGGLYSGSTLNNESQWSFSVIDPIFETVKKSIGGTQTNYDMWGHSAGAQFVHRFILFKQGTKINRAVASNAGWYTLPDVKKEYPYGLKNTPFTTTAILNNFFTHKLTLHLGTADTVRDNALNTSAGAEAQGKNRYERGTYFFKESERIKNNGSHPFNWQKRENNGVGHDYRKMAIDASSILY